MRLVGVRLMHRDDEGRAIGVVEYHLDERGRARAVVGWDTVAAATYASGAAAPEGCYEGAVARRLAQRLRVPFQVGRVYRPDEGVPFLICVLADNRPRMYTWSEAVEEDAAGDGEVEGT